MLKLCQPFCQGISPKILKIDPAYVTAIVTNEKEAKERNMHAKGKTFLINYTPPSSKCKLLFWWQENREIWVIWNFEDQLLKWSLLVCCIQIGFKNLTFNGYELVEFLL